jgi:hypothetical protein
MSERPLKCGSDDSVSRLFVKRAVPPLDDVRVSQRLEGSVRMKSYRSLLHRLATLSRIEFTSQIPLSASSLSKVNRASF